MNRLRLWTSLFVLAAVIPFSGISTSAQPPSGGSLGATSPRDLSVAPDLGLDIKSQVLDAIKVKAEAGQKGTGPKFPNLDHRPHETAQKLAAILAEAATEAATRIGDDKGGQVTADFRTNVGQKIDALLKESSGRESDWRWLVNEATNIDRKLFLKSYNENNKDTTSPNLKPNLTRWSHLAYIYQEYAQAAAEFADELSEQRKKEDELILKAMQNRGGSTISNSGGWVTIPGQTEFKRRRWFICR